MDYTMSGFVWDVEGCIDNFSYFKYPDPNKPYTLFTDASKHAWACVLTQEYEHEKDNKTYKINHPITLQVFIRGKPIKLGSFD